MDYPESDESRFHICFFMIDLMLASHLRLGIPSDLLPLGYNFESISHLFHAYYMPYPTHPNKEYKI